ncbi:hypothetical protein [Sneathiella sp.]|uniref:hypothetical protein n=1 Tax=Sneathiella sp. TaxID=1964365 RepID=UPI002631DE98|nr:hypothetical protein [Sneathiella sp.]MDF2368180.1 hypothetical protein [Sneathiella sp.]
MTKNSQDASNSPQIPELSGFDPTAMLRAFIPALNGTSSSSSSPAANLLEMNQHWTTFLTKRLKKDAELIQQFAKCSNPMEMNATYLDFFSNTFEDYQRELSEMAELGQKAMSQQEAPSVAKAGEQQNQKN